MVPRPTAEHAGKSRRQARQQTTHQPKVPCQIGDAVIRALLILVALSTACAARAPEVHGRAILLVERGRIGEARVLLEERVRSHPDDTGARRLLVRVHGFAGNLGAARVEAERLAARLGPASAVPWVELGHALELAHRYDEALSLYDRAAEVAPRDPAGPRTGGLRAAAWGEHEIARPRLEEALRRAPGDAEVWHALGHVCLSLEAFDDAERAYRSGLEADPAALENRVGLATLAVVRKDPARALAEYEALLAARPGFADAYLGRSWALMALGRLAEAERALDEAALRRADPRVIARQRRELARRRAEAGPR